MVLFLRLKAAQLTSSTVEFPSLSYITLQLPVCTTLENCQYFKISTLLKPKQFSFFILKNNKIQYLLAFEVIFKNTKYNIFL